MSVPISGQIIGTVLFFIGLWILSYCSKVEKQDKEKMKSRHWQPSTYRERKARQTSERTYQVRGAVLSLGGYAVSMAGIVTFIVTTQWAGS